MSIVSIEELNTYRLRSMAKDIAHGAETLHFLIYSECGDDMIRWAADRLTYEATGLRDICDKVHPDED